MSLPARHSSPINAKHYHLLLSTFFGHKCVCPSHTITHGWTVFFSRTHRCLVSVKKATSPGPDEMTHTAFSHFGRGKVPFRHLQLFLGNGHLEQKWAYRCIVAKYRLASSLTILLLSWTASASLWKKLCSIVQTGTGTTDIYTRRRCLASARYTVALIF